MAEVLLEGIRKRFGEVETIHGLDLTVEEGEFVVFVGPSGCGKSTLLRLIAGLEEITEGRLSIAGQTVNDVPPADRGVAMVFQSYALYPHMSVFENMAFGLKLARRGKAEIRRRVEAAARILQIEPLLERRPSQLSGGQRQRVAIGRAIVREPSVFLFDEPLSNLDAALRIQMRMEISRLHHELGTTMIYVTHDQVEAMTMADKIVVLNDGRIAQVGAPLTLYHHPADRFVAGFIGSPCMNFLEGELLEGHADGARVKLADGTELPVAVDAAAARSGDAVTVGVRPEHVVAEEQADAAVSGRVEVVEQLGESTLLNVATDTGTALVARFAGNRFFTHGEDVRIGVVADGCHLFDARGAAFARVSGAEDVRACQPVAAVAAR
ncbi:ABC transporter ATP-binding protein [Arhodomonas sp. AD133]|uniref:ABC transporter ATP-binding protein n=1 Tax=Arhodomonas sp. AD133 TaxID=3415009 RepID=UPI003EBF1B08